METLKDGTIVMSCDELYGPGLFTGKLTVETTRGEARILSTDWATVLETPKQTAWLEFSDGSRDKFIETDEIFKL